MQHPYAFTLLLLLFACGGCDGDDGRTGWALTPPGSGARPVRASGKLRGIYPVGSKLPDRQAPGGFGPCDNYPFPLGDKPWGTKGAVALVAFADEPVAYFKNLGFAVRLINRTGGTVSFPACDSCLQLVREAQDASGQWRAIEFTEQPICGNSFHRVFLKSNQYWQFPARTYEGPTKTKLRFRLDRGGEPVLYSNEFDGAVTAAQFANPAEGPNAGH